MYAKLPMSIDKGLPPLLKYIKAGAIAKRMGRSSSWFSQRLSHTLMHGKPLSFNEEDIKAINAVLELLGEAYQSFTLEFVDNDPKKGFTDSSQLALLVLKDTFFPQLIAVDMMGRTSNWFTSRTAGKHNVTGKQILFSRNDASEFCLHIRAFATRLRDVMLT